MNPAIIPATVEALAMLFDWLRSRQGRRARRARRDAVPEQMTLSMGEQVLPDNPQAAQAEKERNGK